YCLPHEGKNFCETGHMIAKGINVAERRGGISNYHHPRSVVRRASAAHYSAPQIAVLEGLGGEIIPDASIRKKGNRGYALLPLRMLLGIERREYHASRRDARKASRSPDERWYSEFLRPAMDADIAQHLPL